MYKKSTILLAAIAILSSSLPAHAGQASKIELRRDNNYELHLKYQASADTAITPARVLRWLKSLRGQSLAAAPSNFEFQPIVRVRESRQQVIAQIAYKF